jgi:hypothetical protein
MTTLCRDHVSPATYAKRIRDIRVQGAKVPTLPVAKKYLAERLGAWEAHHVVRVDGRIKNSRIMSHDVHVIATRDEFVRECADDSADPGSPVTTERFQTNAHGV